MRIWSNDNAMTWTRTTDPLWEEFSIHRCHRYLHSTNHCTIHCFNARRRSNALQAMLSKVNIAFSFSWFWPCTFHDSLDEIPYICLDLELIILDWPLCFTVDICLTCIRQTTSVIPANWLLHSRSMDWYAEDLLSLLRMGGMASQTGERDYQVEKIPNHIIFPSFGIFKRTGSLWNIIFRFDLCRHSFN